MAELRTRLRNDLDPTTREAFGYLRGLITQDPRTLDELATLLHTTGSTLSKNLNPGGTYPPMRWDSVVRLVERLDGDIDMVAHHWGHLWRDGPTPASPDTAQAPPAPESSESSANVPVRQATGGADTAPETDTAGSDPSGSDIPTTGSSTRETPTTQTSATGPESAQETERRVLHSYGLDGRTTTMSAFATEFLPPVTPPVTESGEHARPRRKGPSSSAPTATSRSPGSLPPAPGSGPTPPSAPSPGPSTGPSTGPSAGLGPTPIPTQRSHPRAAAGGSRSAPGRRQYPAPQAPRSGPGPRPVPPLGRGTSPSGPRPRPPTSPGSTATPGTAPSSEPSTNTASAAQAQAPPDRDTRPWLTSLAKYVGSATRRPGRVVAAAVITILAAIGALTALGLVFGGHSPAAASALQGQISPPEGMPPPGPSVRTAPDVTAPPATGVDVSQALPVQCALAGAKTPDDASPGSATSWLRITDQAYIPYHYVEVFSGDGPVTTVPNCDPSGSPLSPGIYRRAPGPGTSAATGPRRMFINNGPGRDAPVYAQPTTTQAPIKTVPHDQPVLIVCALTGPKVTEDTSSGSTTTWLRAQAGTYIPSPYLVTADAVPNCDPSGSALPLGRLATG